jgi:hypothetical protein
VSASSVVELQPGGKRGGTVGVGEEDLPVGEPPWVRRRVCGLRDLQVGGSGSSLPVVMFELNRG